MEEKSHAEGDVMYLFLADKRRETVYNMPKILYDCPNMLILLMTEIHRHFIPHFPPSTASALVTSSRSSTS